MQSHTIRCQAIHAKPIHIADINMGTDGSGSTSHVTVDVACVSIAEHTHSDILRVIVETVREKTSQMSGASLEDIATTLAQILQHIVSAQEVRVTVCATLDTQDCGVESLSWTVSQQASQDGQSEQEDHTSEEMLPVETISRHAVLCMESKVPNAEQVFRMVIVALDGIPGNEIEGISPLYYVSDPTGTASHTAVLSVLTTMSAQQLTRALQAIYTAHEGAVQIELVDMTGLQDDERTQLHIATQQPRAAVLAPWMDMDPMATFQGDPLAYLLASAPDAPFVGMQSDHWIIGGES